MKSSQHETTRLRSRANSRQLAFVNSAACVLLSLVLISGLNAQGSDWSGSASGTSAPFIEDPGNHTTLSGWGGGQLGNFTAVGTQQIHDDFSITGELTMLSADGEELQITYEGQVTIGINPDGPYLFTAQLTANGGTGRFAQAAGSATMSGSINEYSRTWDVQFEGELDVSATMSSTGSLQLDSLELAKGQEVAYIMSAHDKSDPVISQSGSLKANGKYAPNFSSEGIRIQFAVESATHNQFGRPLHVITTSEGMLYGHLEGQCIVEIEAETGLATQTVDAMILVLGGTDSYEGASGAMHLVMQSEPTYGDGRVGGTYELSGNLQFEKKQLDQPVFSTGEDRSGLIED